MPHLTPTHLSNELLLHDNPVQLEPDGRYSREFVQYTMLLGSRRLPIGGLSIIFDDTYKTLYWPAILPELRGNGFGVAAYVAASQIPDQNGEQLPLLSDAPGVSASAERVWQSLVRRGMAQLIDSDIQLYRFLDLPETRQSHYL